MRRELVLQGESFPSMVWLSVLKTEAVYCHVVCRATNDIGAHLKNESELLDADELIFRLFEVLVLIASLQQDGSDTKEEQKMCGSCFNFQYYTKFLLDSSEQAEILLY